MKVALSEILWTAANEWLHPRMDFGWADDFDMRTGWSCHAVQAALNGRPPRDHFDSNQPGPAWDFLRSLGCDGVAAPGKRLRGEQQQGVRYMWLLLAAKVAEDENIMVEVTK